MIVRATIDLAHDLGLSAVAEGVESQESRHKLQELARDRPRGYHLGKPLPPDKLLEWAENSLGTASFTR